MSKQPSKEVAPGEVVVEVKDLAKTFSLGFFRKQVHAVNGATFNIHAGEVFGLVGPNGAGKTTTLKMLMGLVKPTRGSARIFGHQVPTRRSRENVGYLPEISYYYDYLKPAEILEFYGKLYGMGGADLKRKVGEMLEIVGLSKAKHKPLRKFSKGMLQRIGLAQALISDPDLIFLDEPQSGLDPIGRKEVADIILSLRERGKTVFFSSHILPDVERICDRVAVMIEGKIVDIGPLKSLLNPRRISTEVIVHHLEPDQLQTLNKMAPGLSIVDHHESVTLEIPGEVDVQLILRYLVDQNTRVEQIIPRHENLEDLFIREANRIAAFDPS